MSVPKYVIINLKNNTILRIIVHNSKYYSQYQSPIPIQINKHVSTKVNTFKFSKRGVGAYPQKLIVFLLKKSNEMKKSQ